MARLTSRLQVGWHESTILSLLHIAEAKEGPGRSKVGQRGFHKKHPLQRAKPGIRFMEWDCMQHRQQSEHQQRPPHAKVAFGCLSREQGLHATSDWQSVCVASRNTGCRCMQSTAQESQSTRFKGREHCRAPGTSEWVNITRSQLAAVSAHALRAVCCQQQCCASTYLPTPCWAASSL